MLGVDGADWRAELVGSEEVQAEVDSFLSAVLGTSSSNEPPRRRQRRGASSSSAHDEV